MNGGLVNMLPGWMRSVRFRITILYSTVLFVLAAIMVGTLYFALQASVHEQSVYKGWGNHGPYESTGTGPGADEDPGQFPQFERDVDRQTLASLKRYSFAALGVLFVASLGVGWVISGRVLSPIGRITNVANDIQATDLSRRIGLGGPADELKRLADTFDQMLERLETAFAAQRQFVADASHELRNPLATIRTNIDVVLNDPGATERDLRQMAVVVRRATDRMSRLADDLLALARLEAPATTRERIDIADVVREVADEFAAPARERNLELETRLSGPADVSGDRDALKRAVVNLVDNAIRFTTPSTTVRAHAGQMGNWVWVAIEDHGPGIPAEHRALIFDRFWRADKSRARSRGGSGLGLSIVKQIAEAHEGGVRVFSKVGEGSTFVLWIPAPQGRRPASGMVPQVLPIEASVKA